jgi:uroporphyrinogen decarboxylase
MKFAVATLTCLLASSAIAFSPASNPPSTFELASSVNAETVAASKGGTSTKDPLLIRAARGEQVERTPVWMMRQAGRHIAEYRDLCKKWPTFRQRSEIPEVAVEVSLQPWRNYKTDGCILFSDILTPLPGMGVEFTIDEKVGPLMEPMRSWQDIEKVRTVNANMLGQACRMKRAWVADAVFLSRLSLIIISHTFTYN